MKPVITHGNATSTHLPPPSHRARGWVSADIGVSLSREPEHRDQTVGEMLPLDPAAWPCTSLMGEGSHRRSPRDKSLSDGLIGPEKPQTGFYPGARPLRSLPEKLRDSFLTFTMKEGRGPGGRDAGGEDRSTLPVKQHKFPERMCGCISDVWMCNDSTTVNSEIYFNVYM